MPIQSISNYLNTLNNIDRTAQKINDSLNRLSSGRKQANPGDNIAGTAIGAQLTKEIVGIDSAIINISAASSMLDVASAAYDQVGIILNDMNGLAAQSVSSTATSDDLINFNIQFQQYAAQIDLIAKNATFNGINVTDGSLANSSLITTSAASNSTSASGIATIVTALGNGEAISITVDGTAVTFTGNNTGTFTTPLLQLDVTTYTTPTAQATQLVSQISSILDYSGTNTSVLAAKTALSKLSISNPASGKIKITALNGGTRANSIIVQSTSAAGNFTLNGTNAGASAGLTLGGNATAGTNGDLPSGTFSSGTTAFSGTASTVVKGSIGDSMLKSITVTTQSTTGVDVSGISNNPSFIGQISGFGATYVSSNIANISIKVGDYTYTANAIKTNVTSDTIITLASSAATGGFFELQFSANNGMTISNQTDANSFAARLNAAFSSLTFTQKRSMTNFTAAGYVYPTGITTPSGDLSGVSFSMISDNFSSSLAVSDVEVTYSSSSNAVIQITAGGEVYQSGYNYDGSTLSIGNTITSTSGKASDGRIGLVSQTNPDHIIIMQYQSSTSLSLSTQAQSDGFSTSLKNAFGIGSGSNNGTTFQVGPSASDVMNITIPGVTTALLFLTSGGTYTNISIDTLSNAQTAQSVLANSIYILESAKANVGSEAAVLNYSKAYLETSKFNIEIARDNYTATDISTESTKLAKAILQADINSFVLNSQISLNRALLRLLER